MKNSKLTFHFSLFTFHFQAGQSLVELMVTIGLAAVILPALLTGFISARNGRAQQEQRQQAIALVREGQEVTRIVREKDWNTFAQTGATCTIANPCHPEVPVGTTTWALVAGVEHTASGFDRIVIVSDVCRNSSGNIVVCTDPSAIPDPSTKLVTTTVGWSTPIPNSSVSTTEYLTRNGNAAFIDTTTSDFNQGTVPASIVVTNTFGGELTLGPGGGSGDWCQPSLILATQDLPKSGVANGIHAIEGTVFAATGDNSSGVSFAKVNITTTYPPLPTLQNTYDGFKTNGIFGETNYAYLATDTNSKEIDIIDLNKVVGGKYQEAGYFNAPGNKTGDSVYIFNNIGFMTDGSNLYTFDLSTPQGSPPSSRSGSRALLGSASISGKGNKVIVVQDPTTHVIYAYVASSSTSSQLQIFQVSSNGQTISLAGSKNLSPSLGAIDLFVSSDGSRVYLVTGYSAVQNNIFVLNTSNKGSIPAPLSSTNTGGMSPKGIAFIQNRVIVVGINGTYQYQVFQVNNDILSNCDSTNSSVGKLSIGTGVNGVSSVFQSNGDAYSYIITGDSSSELKIIRGGAGGAGGLYAPQGIFESRTFDAGHSVAFNYFSLHDQTVSGTTSISYEVSIKLGLTGGSCGAGITCCKDVSFSPGDFTPNPFVPPTALPFKTAGGYTNPGQCLQYRATLATTDTSKTPILYDMSFNYSP